MKAGDLVVFESAFWDREKEYANPGLILDKDDSHRQARYRVMWSDSRVTMEHSGLLKKVSELPVQVPE